VIPYRTGITTIKELLSKICRLLLIYDKALRIVIPQDKWVYVDAIKKACEDFILNVPNPRPSNEA